MSEALIEQSRILIKEGEGDNYVSLFPRFKRIFLSHPGAVSVRLLRDRTAKSKFLCAMEWESPAAKALLLADPAIKEWMTVFWPLVENEENHYFDEVG